jgi:hypothetical protein
VTSKAFGMSKSWHEEEGDGKVLEQVRRENEERGRGRAREREEEDGFFVGGIVYKESSLSHQRYKITCTAVSISHLVQSDEHCR